MPRPGAVRLWKAALAAARVQRSQPRRAATASAARDGNSSHPGSRISRVRSNSARAASSTGASTAAAMRAAHSGKSRSNRRTGSIVSRSVVDRSAKRPRMARTRQLHRPGADEVPGVEHLAPARAADADQQLHEHEPRVVRRIEAVPASARARACAMSVAVGAGLVVDHHRGVAGERRRRARRLPRRRTRTRARRRRRRRSRSRPRGRSARSGPESGSQSGRAGSRRPRPASISAKKS